MCSRTECGDSDLDDTSPNRCAMELSDERRLAYYRVWGSERRSRRSVPPVMGHYFRDTIPNCETEVVPDAGHLWVLENLNTVLHALVRAQPNRT